VMRGVYCGPSLMTRSWPEGAKGFVGAGLVHLAVGQRLQGGHAVVGHSEGVEEVNLLQSLDFGEGHGRRVIDPAAAQTHRLELR
jgi:hypothetical protein